MNDMELFLGRERTPCMFVISGRIFCWRAILSPSKHGNPIGRQILCSPQLFQRSPGSPSEHAG
jgi:hypothetical protein